MVSVKYYIVCSIGKKLRSDSMMKVTMFILLWVFILFACANPVSAHQPRIISEQVVEIKNPEVSQAFYATLKGSLDEYQIQAEEEFDLYIGLLVPDLPDIRKDYIFEVYQVVNNQPTMLYSFDGKQAKWEPFYEPFGGDNYFQGPELNEVVPAGQYQILVSNRENEGKYVLSVGRDESFTLSEAVQTILRLPSVKRFFGKSPWTAYFNLVGVFMVLSLLLLAGGIFGLYRITAHLLRK